MNKVNPIPFAEYIGIDAINWSTLKELRRSPLRYRYRLDNPRGDTTRLAIGRAAHTAVLEPHRFLVEYACYKGTIRRGKEWDAFKEIHERETILKLDEYQLCLDIAAAVRSHPVASKYLAKGGAEHTLQWRDPDTGLACKGRVDWLGVDYFVDFKTVADIDSNRFATVAARMGYFGQSAFYREGLTCSTGKLHAPVIIAAEVDPPHDVAVFRIDDDSLFAASEEVKGLLQRAALCRSSESWPGLYAEEQTLRMPRWMLDDESDIAIGDDITFGSVAKEA